MREIDSLSRTDTTELRSSLEEPISRYTIWAYIGKRGPLHIFSHNAPNQNYVSVAKALAAMTTPVIFSNRTYCTHIQLAIDFYLLAPIALIIRLHGYSRLALIYRLQLRSSAL